ncbi:MAG: AAA family ATPase [Balneolaceae bacterium]
MPKEKSTMKIKLNGVDNRKLSGEKSKTWFHPTDPFKEPVPELEFIVDGYCAKGLITVIGGSAGSGKSLLNQILFQKRNCELLPTKKGKAIYLTGADSSEFEIRRRAKAFKENSGLLTVELPEDKYCVATNKKFMESLEKNIIQGGFDAVIFDTLADFHEGSLNEAEAANNTMKNFRNLAKSSNTSVIIITHTKKGSKIKNRYDIEDISDSRVFGTKADFVFALKSEYQNDGNNLIELNCVKSRSSKHLSPLRAKIYYKEDLKELRIDKADDLFSNELEKLSKKQERQLNIDQTHILKKDGNSHSEIAKKLDIAKGSVSNYLNEKPSWEVVIGQ